jgi:adenylate kinase family enzyme
VIVILMGLPGVGKTALASAIADAMPASVLDRDRVRNAVFPPADVDYSVLQNDLASRICYMIAEYILGKDPERLIVFDGRPFSKCSQIREVMDLAGRCGQVFHAVLCTAPEDVVLERLRKDMENPALLPSRRTPEKYWAIRDSFEPPCCPHLVVDTSRPIDECVVNVLQYLGVERGRVR